MDGDKIVLDDDSTLGKREGGEYEDVNKKVKIKPSETPVDDVEFNIQQHIEPYIEQPVPPMEDVITNLCDSIRNDFWL